MNKLGKYYSPSSLHDLHAVLVDDIFFRLPLNSLFKCKSVCKRWDSLISSREFQEDYMFHRMSNLQIPCTLVRKEMCAEGCNQNIIYNNLDLITNIGNKLECSNFSVLAYPRQLMIKKNCRSQSYCVLGSSNGLLLCSVDSCYNHPYELYVCSPIIKQWIKIPNPTNRNIYFECLGFGFTTQLEGLATVTNFRVIIALREPCRFEIFSSETGTWEVHYSSSNLNIRLGTYRDVAVVNKLGILHWITDKIDGVLAYDPSNKDWCSIINLPRHNNQVADNLNMPSYKDIITFEENLRYLEMLQTPDEVYHLYIWTLESYDNSGIWHLDHKIQLDDSHFFMKEYRYKIGQFDSDILYIWICTTKELLTYDFRTQKLNKPAVGWKRSSLEYEQGALPVRLPVWPTTIKLGTTKPIKKLKWNMFRCSRPTSC